jgi:hypothetical protein
MGLVTLLRTAANELPRIEIWDYCPRCGIVPPTEVDRQGDHERNYSRRPDGFPDQWERCERVLHIRILRDHRGRNR